MPCDIDATKACVECGECIIPAPKHCAECGGPSGGHTFCDDCVARDKAYWDNRSEPEDDDAEDDAE